VIDQTLPLEWGDIAPSVQRFVDAATRRIDPLRDLCWDDIDGGRLTDLHVDALRLVTLVEDHLPGYFAAYNGKFPLDETTSLRDFAINREIYHYTVRWAQEEDRHAYLLSRYVVSAGIETQDGARAMLATQGRKHFQLPYESWPEIFAYTFLQEKFTQLYYQQLAAAVQEPVLRRLLRALAQDEGRHFVFFSHVLESALRRYGSALTPAIEHVVTTFQMPLASLLDGYWRLALRATDAVGGETQTSGYDDMLRLLQRTGIAPSAVAEVANAVTIRKG